MAAAFILPLGGILHRGWRRGHALTFRRGQEVGGRHLLCASHHARQVRHRQYRSNELIDREPCGDEATRGNRLAKI